MPQFAQSSIAFGGSLWAAAVTISGPASVQATRTRVAVECAVDCAPGRAVA